MLCAELWEAQTAGIQEVDSEGGVDLIATFETNDRRLELLRRFRAFLPEWTAENDPDWVAETQKAWPGRCVGERLFVAPPWNRETTPAGRVRIVQNPGLACGTGEHPCTQLALLAIERYLRPGAKLIDIGTGSGILVAAALRLGAQQAIGIDVDVAAIQAARENLRLNSLDTPLAAGCADCIADNWADITVANINATVLLSLLDELFRITRKAGRLILTGFPDSELAAFEPAFPRAGILQMAEWRLITASIT